MKSLILLSLMVLVIACNNTPDKPATTPTDSVTKVKHTPVAITGINIDKDVVLPIAFLASLKAAHYPEQIHITNKYMFIGKDTAAFPTNLKLNQLYSFKARQDSMQYQLDATRTSITEISFKYMVSSKGAVVHQYEGKTVLQPMFFLASEMPEDETTGEAYGANEYFNVQKGQEIYSINIGMGRDDSHQLRALIKPGKKDQEKLFPNITLRTP